jgi:site-specific recombinase XerD
MKVNFSLKPSKKGKDGKAPINIDISFKGDRIIIFSGKRCNPDNWNGKRVTGTEEFKDDTNAILAAHERKLMAIESDAIKRGIVLTKEYLKTKFQQEGEDEKPEAKVVEIEPIDLPDDFFKLMQKFIDDTTNGIRKSPQGRKLGKDSIQVAEATKMHLENFCREKRYRLTFFNVNEKFYKKFTDYLYDDLDHYDNTVGKYIRNLKTFLNWANKTTVQNKKFKVPSEEKDIMVLTPEQLNALIDVEINEATVSLNYLAKKKTAEPESKEETIEMLRRTRDIFVIGCTTTLRVSDLLKLDPQTNLIKASNYKLKIKTGKTGKFVLIDLPDYTEPIINKYIQIYNKVLPPISDQRFNENLKKLGEFMNWDQIKIEVVRHKRYEPVKNTMTLSALLTSHVMRRTGITTLLIGGMDQFAVKKISGHSKNSRSFTKYIEFSQAYINTEYKKAWENIRGMGYGKTVMKVS